MALLQSKNGKQVARDYPMSDTERTDAKKSTSGKSQLKLMLAMNARNGEVPSGGLKKSKKLSPALKAAALRRLKKTGKKNGN